MDMFQHRTEEVARLWGWFLALSIVLVILGIIAVSSTIYTTLLTVLFLGVLLMIAGIGQCVLAIRAPQWSGFFLNLLAGLLSMVLGYLFLQTSGATAVSLTLLMALYFIVSGLFKIFTAVFHRFHQWNWMLGNGVVTLLLGILLWSQWPVSGFWAIGLFLGIDLLMAGTTWMILAFSLRRLQHPGQHSRGRFAPQ